MVVSWCNEIRIFELEFNPETNKLVASNNNKRKIQFENKYMAGSAFNGMNHKDTQLFSLCFDYNYMQDQEVTVRFSMSKKHNLARYNDTPQKYKDLQTNSQHLHLLGNDYDYQIESHRYSVVGPQNKTDLQQSPILGENCDIYIINHKQVFRVHPVTIKDKLEKWLIVGSQESFDKALSQIEKLQMQQKLYAKNKLLKRDAKSQEEKEGLHLNI